MLPFIYAALHKRDYSLSITLVGAIAILSPPFLLMMHNRTYKHRNIYSFKQVILQITKHHIFITRLG